MAIVIFDTSVASSNTGDFIIMDSVNEEISSLFPEKMMFTTYTHDKISKPSYDLVNSAEYAIVGGSNLLSSNMNSYNQWKINLYDSFYLNDIVLMGVGWWQYQSKPNFYTHYLLKSILHKEVIHSVRDSYTLNMLKSIGIKNVVNTACPTMWKLTIEHCKEIPSRKGKSVVFTLTDYNKAPLKDEHLIQTLDLNYDTVKFWPQGANDLNYFKSLKVEADIELLPPTLESYNDLLYNFDRTLDYVGTRLHAGIRALQAKRRAVIIGIDNRAEKKADDFNLMICPRKQINKLNDILVSKFDTRITLPKKEIDKWKNQFK